MMRLTRMIASFSIALLLTATLTPSAAADPQFKDRRHNTNDYSHDNYGHDWKKNRKKRHYQRERRRDHYHGHNDRKGYDHRWAYQDYRWKHAHRWNKGHHGQFDFYHSRPGYVYNRERDHAYRYRRPHVVTVHPSVRYKKRHYTPRYSVGDYYTCHSNTVFIKNYRDYDLRHPPSGYHWVRDHDRGDAILASVATGAIIGLVVGVVSVY